MGAQNSRVVKVLDTIVLGLYTVFILVLLVLEVHSLLLG